MGFNSKYTGAEVEKLLDSIKDNALVESISWENIKDRPNSIEGYGIIDVYNKTEINNSLLKYVTLSTDQNITGIKSFINGFKLGDALITYNKDKKTFVFPGNLLVEGGIAWNSSIEGFEPKTITDAVMIDGRTLGRNENGEIYVKGGTGGSGGGSIEYPLTWSGYSSGSYDGSASKNIAIPSLVSQLTNDVDFITSTSVNSLLTDYLSKSGGTVNGDITAPTFIGNLMGRWLPLLPSKNANEIGTAFGWMNTANGDSNIPSDRAGAIVSFDSGERLNAMQFFSPYTTNTLKYRSRTHIDNSWKEWREVAFTDSTMYPTGDIAMQFPDGEYIDRWGNIVLPSTASQWSVKNSNMMLLSVRNDGEIQLNGTIHFTKEVPMIKMVESGWAQSKVMWHGWDSTEGDSLWLQIPSGVENDVYFKLCRLAPSILNTSLQVNGNLLATGEITQHSSLKLKDVVDTRFLTLKELSELKPYSFYWKDKRDDKLHAGAVADYVMPILPEVISTDKDNIHSMNYANAAWIVSTSHTPYISKHEKEIVELKETVKKQKEEIKILKGKLNLL